MKKSNKIEYKCFAVKTLQCVNATQNVCQEAERLSFPLLWNRASLEWPLPTLTHSVSILGDHPRFSNAWVFFERQFQCLMLTFKSFDVIGKVWQVYGWA